MILSYGAKVFMHAKRVRAGVRLCAAPGLWDPGIAAQRRRALGARPKFARVRARFSRVRLCDPSLEQLCCSLEVETLNVSSLMFLSQSDLQIIMLSSYCAERSNNLRACEYVQIDTSI